MEFDPAEQQYALDQELYDLAEGEQDVVQRRADIQARAAQEQVDAAHRTLRRAPGRTGHPYAGMPDRRKRYQETSAHARGDEAPPGAGRERRCVESDHAPGGTRCRRRGPEQGPHRRRPRPADHREPGGAIADRRAGARQGEPGRHRRRLLLRHVAAGVPRRTTRLARAGRFSTCRTRPTWRSRCASTSRSGRRWRSASPPRCWPTRFPGVQSAARITRAVRRRPADGEQAGPLRQFEVVLRVDKPDPRLRPGTTVRVLIAGTRTHQRAHGAPAGGVPAERPVGRVCARGQTCSNRTS